MKAKKRLPYDPYRDGIWFGILERFLQCRHQARLYADGVRQRGRWSNFSFGLVTHDILEELYKAAKKKNTTADTFSKAWVKRATDRVYKRWEKKGMFKRLSTEDRADAEFAFAIALAVMRHYPQAVAGDFVDETVLVEEWFQLEAPGGRGVIYKGKIDLVKRKKTRLWLGDHKTRARIEPDKEINSLPMSLQQNTYVWAAEQILDEPIRGTFTNVIRNPGLYRRKDETLKSYAARVEEDVVTKPDHYFMRWECPKLRRDVKDFEEHFGLIINEFLDWWEGTTPTFKNPCACVGRYTCDFLALCGSGQESEYETIKKPFGEVRHGN